MEFRELFETGMSYGTFLSIASESEIAKIREIGKNLVLSDEHIEALKNVDKHVNILVSAESWCPYVRATLPVMYRISEINPKLRLGIITEGRGFMFLREKIGVEEDDYVIPTIALLDEDYNLINTYIGKPEKYREIGFRNVSSDFFAGKRADDIVEEILRKIK